MLRRAWRHMPLFWLWSAALISLPSRLFSTQQFQPVLRKRASGWSLRCGAGTGTCAVMAAMWAKGELQIGEDFVHESIVGTTFTGRLHGETTVGGERAVVPTIAGQVRTQVSPGACSM